MLFVSVFLSIPSSAKGDDTPSLLGLSASSGATGVWISLQGLNISHVDPSIRTSGYQSIYYVVNGDWANPQPFAPSDLEELPDGHSVRVHLPDYAATFQFWIDACADWAALSGCFSIQDYGHSYVAKNFDYAGLSSTKGNDAVWITLEGFNLNHIDGRDSGYQAIYYSTPGMAFPAQFPESAIRSIDGSSAVQVLIPTGTNTYTFQIDACTNWRIVSGCTSLVDNSLIYSATSSFSFTGFSASSGNELSWVTLQGTNLSHSEDGTTGYKSVYYSPYGTNTWSIFDDADVRNETGTTSIQVRIPMDSPKIEFRIEICSLWKIAGTPPSSYGCSYLTNSDANFTSSHPATFTGVDPTSGPDYSWVKLTGTNLSHRDGSLVGYKTVSYTYGGHTYSFTDSNIRNNSDGTIDVFVPMNATNVSFEIYACHDWANSANCFTLNNYATYTASNTRPVTFTGINPVAGPDSYWISLNGENLSHVDGRASGYQIIQFNADSSGWTELSGASIRNSSPEDGTIQVQIPAGVNSISYRIGACYDWSAGIGCFPTSNTFTYSANAKLITLHPKNGDADTTTYVTSGETYQLPKLADNSTLNFKNWNTAEDGSGFKYSAFTNVLIEENTHFYAQWIAKNDPQISLYMDAPFVQASYASGPRVVTENFNSLTSYQEAGNQLGTCSGSSGTPFRLNIGGVIGTCSIFESNDLGSSTILSSQVVGGTGGKMATVYPGTSFVVKFDNNEKYVGFWWSAGSPGNTVEFLAANQVVAEMTVDQLFGIFGSAPTDEAYATASDAITAIDGNSYPKKYYFGNPDGYISTTPNVKSSVVKDEPFVYIHAFASNGAYFDSVRFSGSGFEIDNITVSRSSVSVNNRLLYVQGIAADSSALDTTQEIYFVTYDGNSNDSGTAPTDALSPYAPNENVNIAANTGNVAKSNYVFSGWNTVADGSGTTYAESSSLHIGSDLNLYAKWTLKDAGGSGGGGTGGGGGYVPPIIITETPNNETPPIVTTEPTTPKSGTTTTKPKGRVTVSKTPTKTVITVKPAITTPAPAPTITNSPSDIQIQGLTNNQRVRVTLIDLNGNKKTVVASNDSQVSKLVNDNPSSKVSIEIVPTLNSALKKGAQIAIKGAKKFQRIRVTIK